MTPSSIRPACCRRSSVPALVLGRAPPTVHPSPATTPRTPTRTWPRNVQPRNVQPRNVEPRNVQQPESSSPEPPTDSGSGGSGLSTEKENEVFLQTLEQLNVTCPDKYIKVGRQACTDIRGGKSFIDIALNSPLGLGPVQSGSVVGAAIGVFCPDQQSKISAGG